MSDAAPESAPSKEPLKKGAHVRIRCDGFTLESVLESDDEGGKTVKVRNLGDVPRERLI